MPSFVEYDWQLLRARKAQALLRLEGHFRQVTPKVVPLAAVYHQRNLLLFARHLYFSNDRTLLLDVGHPGYLYTRLVPEVEVQQHAMHSGYGEGVTPEFFWVDWQFVRENRLRKDLTFFLLSVPDRV